MSAREKLRTFADVGMDVVAVVFMGACSLLVLALGVAGIVFAIRYALGVP